MWEPSKPIESLTPDDARGQYLCEVCEDVMTDTVLAASESPTGAELAICRVCLAHRRFPVRRERLSGKTLVSIHAYKLTRSMPMGEPAEYDKPGEPDHPHGTPPGHDPDFVPPGHGGTPPGQEDQPEEPDEGEAEEPTHPIANPDAPYVDPCQA